MLHSQGFHAGYVLPGGEITAALHLYDAYDAAQNDLRLDDVTTPGMERLFDLLLWADS